MKEYKLCNCIKEFEKKIKENYESSGQNVEFVKVENIAFLFGSDAKGTSLSIPVAVSILKGKKPKKEIVNGLAKYCPFCGKPLFEEIEQEAVK